MELPKRNFVEEVVQAGFMTFVLLMGSVTVALRSITDLLSKVSPDDCCLIHS